MSNMARNCQSNYEYEKSDYSMLLIGTTLDLSIMYDIENSKWRNDKTVRKSNENERMRKMEGR